MRVWLAIALIPSALFAAFEEKPLSARTAAMGEASAASVGAEAAAQNPAALRFLARPEISLGRTRLLGDADLPNDVAAAGIPTSRLGSFGFAYTQFGAPLYHEREATVAHAFLLTPRLAAGVAAQGSFLDMDRYGRASAWSANAGLLGRVHPRVDAGIVLHRVNRPRFTGMDTGPLPDFRAGTAVRWGSRFLASADVLKPLSRPFSYRVGQEVSLSPLLALRAGFETRPQRYAVGFGLRTRFGHVDYAFLSHPFLGDQHQVTLAATWERR